MIPPDNCCESWDLNQTFIQQVTISSQFHANQYLSLAHISITTIHFKAFGDLVYPIMLGGDKPGQDKADKFKEVKLSIPKSIYQLINWKVMGWMNDFVAEDKFVGGTNEMTIADIALIATYSTIKVGGFMSPLILYSYQTRAPF